MIENFYAVIMAGGGGTRLWPLSTQTHPKQMLKILDGRSLFQVSVDRLQPLFQSKQIFVVTVKDQAGELSSQVPNLPFENYLIEPLPRGTASVVGLAAIHLQKMDPAAVMAVLTADHVIKNIPRFHELLKQACHLAQEGYLVTLGIEPTYPSSGYGYIQAGEKLEFPGAFLVERFIEKPEADRAQAFIQSGGYYWNSGMFIWRVDKILSEFARLMPDLYDDLMAISSRLGAPDAEIFTQEIWPTVEKQTIDYGIMEHAEQVAVLAASDLGWEDIGSWDSMYSLFEADSQGNIVKNSQVVTVDSQNVLIFGEDPSKLVAAIGLEDLMIIHCDQVVLVCKKGKSQEVKAVIEKLQKNGLDAFL